MVRLEMNDQVDWFRMMRCPRLPRAIDRSGTSNWALQIILLWKLHLKQLTFRELTCYSKSSPPNQTFSVQHFWSRRIVDMDVDTMSLISLFKRCWNQSAQNTLSNPHSLSSSWPTRLLWKPKHNYFLFAFFLERTVGVERLILASVCSCLKSCRALEWNNRIGRKQPAYR